MKTSQQFGGIWSKMKLAVLESYLGAFGNVMKHQPFTTHYADAFAGSGSHAQPSNESQAALIPLEDIKGSAQIALEKEGFNKYHFNDINPENVVALEELKASHPAKDIVITEQDANAFIRDFCRSLGGRDRAVLFVDPFATEVEWGSLEAIAGTSKIDLWLLFPISCFSRLTPLGGPSPMFNKRVTKMLGDEEWMERIYQKPKQSTGDLFGETAEVEIERVSQEALTEFITEKLNRAFPYASAPLPLKNSKGSTLFLLYFAMANDSAKAIAIGKRIVGSILKRPGLL